MPFVRKTNPEGSQAPTDTRKLFVGRTGELLFFVHMLAFGPDLEVPVSLAGPGGLWHNTSADVMSMHWW